MDIQLSTAQVQEKHGMTLRELKTLAKELGLIETFVLGEKSSHQSGAPLIFDYLIVIDFESTCWDSKNKQSEWQNLPEIIEFPAVLLNLVTGTIEDQFHQYVMPIENPTLSEFCVNLTGITQEIVNGGVPLATCLMLFNKWLKKVTLEKNMSFHKPVGAFKTCTFVTWSDWDLGLCLHNELKRKMIRKPEILTQWIDLRLCYRKFYQRKPQGLKGALAEVGLTFNGREHSGIIDAKNTACLAHKMAKDGCQFAITSSPLPTPPQINSRRHTLGAQRDGTFQTTPLSHSNFSKQRKSVRKGLNCRNLVQVSPEDASSRGKSIQSKDVKRNSPMTSCNTSTPKRQNIDFSSCKRTPPLCRCNRRAVCKVANSPGPNQGRRFFTCPNQKRSLGMVTKSCSFFMWC